MKTKPRVAGIIQARMTSTRLPGKSLADICGEPLLGRLIERARRCPQIDELVLAVPDMEEERPLVERFRGPCTIHQGSLHDVLERFHGAAERARADVVVRLTGDNPLFDAPMVGALIERFLERGDLDRASTGGCPIGVGAEVFTFAALDRARREAAEPYQREHVTPYLYESPGRFRNESFDMSGYVCGLPKDARLTVDTPEDLAVMRAIFERLLPVDRFFGMKEVAELYRAQPALFDANRLIRQKHYKESQT